MSLQSNRAGRAAGLAAGLVALMFAAGSARAHVTMTNPKPWTTVPNGQKGAPPCGMTSPMKNQNPTPYKPGESIMVQWNETIKHPGRFRIVLAEEGQTIPNPMMMMDTSTTLPLFIDGIDAKNGMTAPTAHQRMITLPNKPCTNCILQLIQVMKVAPPYASGADADVYYQCAVITIAGDAPPADAGAPDSGGSGTGGAMGGTGGSTPTGGMSGSTGGMSGSTGGAPGTGGSTPTGGKSGTGGSTGNNGGTGGEEEETGGTGGGGKRPSGGCSVGGNAPASGLLLLAAVGLLIRRRRR
jgi:MYXO-CTERM domain-containing protein